MNDKKQPENLNTAKINHANQQQNNEVERALKVATQYHNSGKLAEAQSIYQQILRAQPNHAIAMHLLGVVAMQAGRYDVAEKLICNAITLKPDLDEAYNNLGTMYESLGRFDESLPQYQKALEIRPGVAVVHFNLANVLRGLGRLEDAVFHYKETIKFSPGYAAAHRQLASIKKHTVYDDDMKAMEKLLEQPATDSEQKIHLAFGLGKAYEDLQQYEKSFPFIQQGNDIKRKSFKFKIQSWNKHITSLETIFSKDFFAKFKGVGSNNKTPIFILGMPRSGTSLVEQILASHSKVYAAGEMHCLNQTIASVFDMSNLSKELQHADIDVFSQLGDKYVSVMKAQGLTDKGANKAFKSVQYITDKMPGNFKLIGLIKLILPNAKIIHCRRNPMDNCLSLFKNYFSKGHVYAYDQIELGQYYNLYARLMEHWHNVLPDFIYDVQYEQMVAEQDAQTRSLLEFCGLDWENACLDFHQTRRAVKTVSAVQVRRPIYKDSVKLWKRYEKQLAPLIESLQNV
jgi:tetratricopeptide (TPR) repeat protein